MLPDPLNLLSRTANLLSRDGPLSALPNPFGGPESDAPADRPPANPADTGDPGLDSLPPGLQGRDTIPYGVAKQLDLPAPPMPPLPGTNPGGPPGTNAPNSAAAPAFGGNAPATQVGPPSAPMPPGGAPAPLPAGQPAVPATNGAPFAQISQAVQSFVTLVTGTATTTTARGADPNLPANPAAARPASANPVPPAMAAAQAAQATAQPAQVTGLASQAGPVAQTLAGTPVAAGTTATPSAANPAAARAGAPEAALPPSQPQPQGRTDAAPAQQRPEGNLLDRLMSLLRPNAASPAQGATAATSAAGATQANAAAATVAGVAVAATQAPTDPRGNVVLAVNDRAAIQRADGPLTGTYTADGPYRRRLRRGSDVMSAQFSRLLMALGLAGPPVTMRGRGAEYELSVALQWLFWLLAIIAYACLGLAVVAFLPAGSDVFGEAGRGWTAGFAFAGLVAAAGAWWFARQLSMRNAGDAQAPGRGDAAED